MWPTDPNWGSLIKTHLDAPGDSPSSGRAQLEAIADRLNAVQAVLEQIVEHGAPLTLAGGETLTQRFKLAGDPMDDLHAVSRAYLLANMSSAASYNRIINGTMQVVQRSVGGSFAAGQSGYVGPDRFFCQNNADGEVSQSAELFPEVATSGQRGAVRQTVGYAPATLGGLTAPGAFWSGVSQVIDSEMLDDFATGRYATVSFWFRSNVTGRFGVTWSEPFGLSQYCSAASFDAVANQPLRVVVTLSVRKPAFRGYLRIGAVAAPDRTAATDDGVPYIGAGIAAAPGVTPWPLASGNWIEVADLRLERGRILAPVSQFVPYDLELMRCQRYYYVMRHRASGPDVAAGHNSRVTINFPTPMRNFPAVTLGAGSQATLDSDIGTTGARFYRTSAFVDVAPGTVFDAEII